MKQLTRPEASIIFKARARMLDVKNNFKGKYPDQVCRACKAASETQTHILLECEELHADNTLKTNTENIFNEDPYPLRLTAKKIHTIMQRLEKNPNCVAPQQRVERSGLSR